MNQRVINLSVVDSSKQVLFEKVGIAPEQIMAALQLFASDGVTFTIDFSLVSVESPSE